MVKIARVVEIAVGAVVVNVSVVIIVLTLRLMKPNKIQ
jgi:hypothetical protein